MTDRLLPQFHQNQFGIMLPQADNKQSYQEWLQETTLHDIVTMLGHIPLDKQPISVQVADFLVKAYVTKYGQMTKSSDLPQDEPRQPGDPFGVQNLMNRIGHVQGNVKSNVSNVHEVSQSLAYVVYSIKTGDSAPGTSYMQKLQQLTDKLEPRIDTEPEKPKSFWQKFNPFK